MPEGETRWARGYRWVLPAIILLVGLGVAYGWTYLVPKSNTKTARIATESGLYQQYAYVITTAEGRREKAANFNPAVQADDAVVVAVLRDLMNTAYDDKVPDGLQPQVENVNEKNYVTFSTNGSKTYFQLFKNSAGELGSVSFWRDSTDNY